MFYTMEWYTQDVVVSETKSKKATTQQSADRNLDRESEVSRKQAQFGCRRQDKGVSVAVVAVLCSVAVVRDGLP